jgi:hypothetical protein
LPSSGGSKSVTFQMRVVWSALHVASLRASGESRMRVMYVLWALKCVTGTSCVRSKAEMSCQTKTLP